MASDITMRIQRFAAISAATAVLLAAGGCGKGSSKNIKIDGVDRPKVNFVDNKLTLSMILEGLEIDGGISVPISPTCPTARSRRARLPI